MINYDLKICQHSILMPTKEYNKSYYENHKEEWKQKYYKTVHCDVCDKDVKKDHYNSHHIKTKKHIALENKKIEEENKQKEVKEIEELRKYKHIVEKMNIKLDEVL